MPGVGVIRAAGIEQIGRAPELHDEVRDRWIASLESVYPRETTDTGTTEVSGIDVSGDASALNTSDTRIDTKADTQTARERRQAIRDLFNGDKPLDRTSLAKTMPINRGEAFKLIDQALAEEG